MTLPTKRTDETIENVLLRIANGETLRAACLANNLAVQTFAKWRDEDKNSDLARAYQLATELGHDAIAEECLDIIDTEAERISDRDGNTRRDPAHVAWLKNRAETRMRLLSKWSPQKYGDNIAMQLTGKDGGAIQVDNSAAVHELVSLLRASKRGDAIEHSGDKPAGALPAPAKPSGD